MGVPLYLCRDEHVEIGYSSELCPMCALRAELARVTEERDKAFAAQLASERFRSEDAAEHITELARVQQERDSYQRDWSAATNQLVERTQERDALQATVQRLRDEVEIAVNALGDVVALGGFAQSVNVARWAEQLQGHLRQALHATGRSRD